MDQPPASSAPPPADLQATGSVDVASEHGRGGIKISLVNSIPPATLAAGVLFWGLAAAAMAGQPINRKAAGGAAQGSQIKG